MRRVGLIAKKIGMTTLYTPDGVRHPVTVLQTGCQTIAVRNKATDGYFAVQLGFDEAKVKNTSQAMRGHFAKAQVTPKRKLMEFRVDDEKALLPLGAEITAEHFVVGQYVDVTGINIGKGFQGAMKRHNFSGGNASHGASISHRSLGSTGHRQDPGRVFKGKKMPGHMGAVQTTQLSLQVLAIDAARNLIMVKGSIPGHDGNYVKVRDAVKKPQPKDLPFPAKLKTAAA